MTATRGLERRPDGRPLIFRTIHGSHLYGLNNATSDEDWYYVFEGDQPGLTQKTDGITDTVRGSLDAFIDHAFSGSHQSVEALFSQEKEFAPGMERKWGRFLDAIRVTGPEVFQKYERTIIKFSYGDFKRRRHAVRLWYNLHDLRESGWFNPHLNSVQIDAANSMATRHEGDDLWTLLKHHGTD